MGPDSSASAVTLSPEERERIVRGFETWLDAALSSEVPPQGLAAELLSALQNGSPPPSLDGVCDLYSLWSAMIALTQEVRLQGRTFKQLNETLVRSLETSAAEKQDVTAETSPPVENPLAEMARTKQAQKKEIDVLVDLRDRLERGRSTARRAADELAPSRLPRLARWVGMGHRYARHTQEILAALTHGYSLTLDRLDQALLDRHVSVMMCEGKMFDPQRMTAVEVEETNTVPEGTVVEVYRNGYEWEDGVYRSAQVKVARLHERNTDE
jgi:molecular chaperone GrpE (heat shock protein)